jgi:GMP synthase-like glutamine amidotransferase
MRALVVQHHHDGGAELFGEHLRGRGYELEELLVMQPGSTHSDVSFPDPASFDVIVPLGSVHGVYEHDVIGSWVHRELDLLRAAHEAGVPMFGICFGAQAITAALGGRVEPAPHAEIGWYHYDTDSPDAVPSGPWFTWHGDRCVLPDGAVELARSPLCPQAFRIGRSVGVQFHPEVTQELVAEWVSSCAPEYFRSRGVSAEQFMADFEVHGAVAAAQARQLFDWFLDDVVP